ncbi:hypothetical protein PMAYCL1PPCAC_12036, partial [Pristionchus mayeri]
SMLRVLPRVASLAGRSILRHHSAAPAALSDELRKKIDGMVAAAPVVVFMKGTQKEPACGFSKNVKLVLDFHDVSFNDHNVLVDAELREGIKAYSEWPTIPQVYVKGEFVGGCDIMIQMHKDGELSDLFDKHEIPNKFGDCKKKE